MGRQAVGGPFQPVFVNEKGTQPVFKLLKLFFRSSGQRQPFAALHGAGVGQGKPGPAAGAQKGHFQIAQIHGKFLPDGAGEPRAVRIESGDGTVLLENKSIDGTGSAGKGIRVTAQGTGRLLVGNRNVGPRESPFPEEPHHLPEFFRSGLDADIPGANARRIQRGLLHGGGFGMGNGKTDYGQSGGNGFPGIKRMFFIQKIGQGIVGFHGK